MVKKSTHRIPALIITFSLVLFLFNPACSQDEKPLPPSQTHKIVKAISKAPGLAKEKKPFIDENLKPRPEEEEGVAETKPVTAEKRELEEPRIVTEEALPEVETGYYVVKKGDTLTGVAARENVYNDSLKWPILGRHNMDRFTYIATAEDLPDKALPEGMKLKFFTQDEVQKNLEEKGVKVWAVNVISSTKKNEVNPAVVNLIRMGFPVYITRANVKGTDYMRVRVGFFSGKTEADVEGRKLMKVLKLSDFWTLRVTEEEAREFGGY